MSVDVRKFVAGMRMTEGNGLSLEGAEGLDRLVRAVRELQGAYPNGAGPVLTAPDGGLWRLGVDNAGNLTTTSV